MVTSVHLADVSALRAVRFLRRSPRAEGLRWAAATLAPPLSASLLPAPKLRRVGLIAAWDSDAALDAFLGDHPAARVFADGYQVRLRPARIVGSWPELGQLPDMSPDIDGPVAALTLGYLKPGRAAAFLRASAKAEAAALSSGALLKSTAMARPSRLVSTFSVWRDLPSMREFAETGGHHAATATNAQRPFHRQQAFVRFTPEVITDGAV